MKKKAPIIFLIILFIFIELFVATNSSHAYTYFNNFNITKFSYKVDTQSATEQSVNSINYNGSTPLVRDSFTTNYHAILNPKFTLNKDAYLSKTQRLHLKLEILTKTFRTDGASYYNTYFVCPQGLDQIRISRCEVYNSDNEIIQSTTAENIPNQGYDTTYSLQSDKSYLVDLEIYYNSTNAVAVRDIALAGRIFAVSVSPATQLTIATGFDWQIAYQMASAFYYEDPNSAANAINEQNEKDEQDRENLDNQQSDIESDAEESTEDMQSATTNITGVVNAFLGNLNSLNRNNCTLPEISAYGFSLGRLNLCTFSPPSWVQNITSAVVSLIVLGMAVHVFKRIMRIAKSMAGGK